MSPRPFNPAKQYTIDASLYRRGYDHKDAEDEGGIVVVARLHPYDERDEGRNPEEDVGQGVKEEVPQLAAHAFVLCYYLGTCQHARHVVLGVGFRDYA